MTGAQVMGRNKLRPEHRPADYDGHHSQEYIMTTSTTTKGQI
jgi:hypothetical protein